MDQDVPTRSERAAAGRAVRAAVPRGALADPGVTTGRADPVGLVVAQEATRIADLLPLRHRRMAASPFAFYRGSAVVMAHDLASVPATGLTVQLCGDAHLANFGLYASPERRLLLDLNDFDETAPGPFEWDVKRLVASVELAAREIGAPAAGRRAAVVATARAYRVAMRGFARMSTLDVWYARLDADRALVEQARPAGGRAARRTERALARARRRDQLSAVEALTTVEGGVRRFVPDPPLLQTLDGLVGPERAGAFRDGLGDLLRGYRRTLPSDRRHLLDRYRLVDVARKVVGVGSVGTRAFVLVVQGDDADDALVLQAKEAQRSVVAAVLGTRGPAQEGRRVVEGQRLMQAASDVLLGWQRTAGVDGVARDYYVRQLRDWKGGFDVAGARLRGLTAYGRACAWTLARAHARSGDRVAVAAYLGGGDRADEAFADLAAACADRAEADHAAFAAAVRSGRLTGVDA